MPCQKTPHPEIHQRSLKLTCHRLSAASKTHPPPLARRRAEKPSFIRSKLLNLIICLKWGGLLLIVWSRHIIPLCNHILTQLKTLSMWTFKLGVDWFLSVNLHYPSLFGHFTNPKKIVEHVTDKNISSPVAMLLIRLIQSFVNTFDWPTTPMIDILDFRIHACVFGSNLLISI